MSIINSLRNPQRIRHAASIALASTLALTATTGVGAAGRLTGSIGNVLRIPRNRIRQKYVVFLREEDGKRTPLGFFILESEKPGQLDQSRIESRDR